MIEIYDFEIQPRIGSYRLAIIDTALIGNLYHDPFLK